MISVNVVELHVHKGIEFYRDGAVRGAGGGDEAEVSAGGANGGVVRGDDEGEAAADGGGVEVGDGEGEEGREAGRRAGPGSPEGYGLGVESPAGAGVGYCEVAGERHAPVVQAGVAEELQAGQGEGAEVERCVPGDIIGKTEQQQKEFYEKEDNAGEIAGK